MVNKAHLFVVKWQADQSTFKYDKATERMKNCCDDAMQLKYLDPQLGE